MIELIKRHGGYWDANWEEDDGPSEKWVVDFSVWTLCPLCQKRFRWVRHWEDRLCIQCQCLLPYMPLKYAWEWLRPEERFSPWVGDNNEADHVRVLAQTRG